METFREYIFSVIAATILCAVVLNFLHDTKAKALIKLLTSLVLVLTIIKPVMGFDMESLLRWENPYFQDAIQYCNQGQFEASKAISERIKTEGEAYILAEANRLNAEIEVELSVDESNLPNKIYISGRVSPSARKQMESFLESSFAITRENQIWTG